MCHKLRNPRFNLLIRMTECLMRCVIINPGWTELTMMFAPSSCADQKLLEEEKLEPLAREEIPLEWKTNERIT